MKHLVIVSLVMLASGSACVTEHAKTSGSDLAPPVVSVASVDFDNIERVLRDYVLSRQQYADLRALYEGIEEFDPTEFMDSDDDDRIVLDKERMQGISGMMDSYEIERELVDTMRRELMLIIEDMDLQYDLVFDSSEEFAIIHSNIEARDITLKVYEEIAERRAEASPTDD